MRNFIFVFCAVACLAMTPQELKIAEHAKNELELSQRSGATAVTETQAADTEANSAEQSAKLADQKADNAVAQIKTDLDKFRGHWGLNAIFFGLKELIGHLLILGIVLVVLSIAIPLIFPPARFFFSLIWGRITAAGSALFRKVESSVEYRIQSHEQTPTSPPAKSLKRSSR